MGHSAVRVGADESTRRAAEQRSLGHARHAHLVEFLRALLRVPGMEGSLLPRGRLPCSCHSDLSAA